MKNPAFAGLFGYSGTGSLSVGGAEEDRTPDLRIANAIEGPAESTACTCNQLLRRLRSVARRRKIAPFAVTALLRGPDEARQASIPGCRRGRQTRGSALQSLGYGRAVAV